MMNWADVVGNAIDIYENREGYCYFYGAKGQVLTDTVMAALIAASPEYFKKFSKEHLQVIIEYSRNKIGIDCSGFINLCCEQYNWSTGYWSDSVNKTTPQLGTWGNILYTTHGGTGRHIGLDVGEGKFLHSPSEGRSIELGIIREYDWEGSGQIKGVSYCLAGNK